MSRFTSLPKTPDFQPQIRLWLRLSSWGTSIALRGSLLSLFLAIALLPAIDAHAQVATGTPGFATLGGGPFDSVDLGNLNVHFSVPIVHKAGRGMPFSYDLAYDGAIWTPQVVSGVKTWQPAFNWGWSAQTAIKVGYISFLKLTTKCDFPPPQTGSYTIWLGFAYHDPWGGTHRFTGTLEADNQNCDNGNTPTFTETATDGSGYTLTATYTTNTITTKTGDVIKPPVNLTSGYSSGTYSATDANGNQISVSNTSSSATFTDTLGQPVLTVSGTSPVSFAYTSPAGAQQYTMNYVQYTVRTGFAIAGTNEYGPLSNPLVDNIQLPDGSRYSFTYEQTPGSCTPLAGTYSGNCVTGRVASVTLPTGGTITYQYSAGPSNTGIFGDGSTAALTRILATGTTCTGPCWQYTRAIVSGTAGPGSAWTTIIVDPNGNNTLINFVEDGNTSRPSYTLYETQRKVYQGATTLLSTTINCYNGQSVTTPANCYNTPVTAPVTRITNFRYLPDSSGVQAETDTTYDSFGLVHEVDDYDYGVGAVGTLLRKTITLYAALGNGIVDRPASVTIQNASNATVAYTSYGYDETAPTTPSGTTPQHIAVSGSRGLLTSVRAQANGTTYLYRKYSYYDTGTLSTSTDVSTSSTTNGATTTYNYNNTGSPSPSCGNSFVTSLTEPLGMSRSMTWDCNGGVMLSLTDENGKTSSTAYSGANYTNVFWRPYSATDQSGTITNYFYYLNTSNQPFQTESKSATFNAGKSIIDFLATTDGFGRSIFQQTKQGPSAANYDTVATCYDNSGDIILSTLPYANAAITGATTACPSTNAGTSYIYDALGRTLSVSDSGGGSTAYTYTKNDVLQVLTSPTQQKQLEYDALGRLRSVCEVTSGTTAFPGGPCAQNTPSTPLTGYWTTYTYDLLGNVTGVTQNAQASSGHQSRNYTYDMLGRLTQETNPEMSNSAVIYTYDVLASDPACGSYTSAGNLLKRLDSAGNASCYSGYDAIHRVGAITYPATSTPAKHFVYDAATVNGTAMANANTRLARAYTCTGTCASNITDLFFSYSATGQTADVWELTPNSGLNNYYHVSSTYWQNGVINTLNLAGLPTITYSVDGEGRPGTTSASSGQNPLTAITYNPASQVKSLTYGSADKDTFAFNVNTGRMSQYQFSVGATPVTDTGVLTWNPNGSLKKLVITDNLNANGSQTCTYSHDDMGRAASANCGSSIWSQTFSYDPFGNINKTVPNGATGMNFQVNYDYANNTNRIITAPYSYTSMGNLTADDHHSYAWDTDGHVVSIDAGSASGVCLTYDALGRAVEKDTGASCNTSSTEIVYGLSGGKLALMNGSTLVKAFVPLPGGAQAVYNASGLQYYRHPDWVGSSRLATTPTRTTYYDVAYAPYGEPYSNTGTQDLSFTGQNQDTEPSVVPGGAGGLYDFLYRKHSPVQGRWLSPDPLGLGAASLNDPQTWNRYAYVGNRPLNVTDSMGLMFCGTDLPCPTCDDPFAPPEDCWPFPPLPGPIPTPDPVPHPPINRQRPRTGGVWANNRTLGLPNGLGSSPLSNVLELLGLSPGTQCGDFIQCGSLGPFGNGFAESVPIAIGCASHPEICAVVVIVALEVTIEVAKQVAKQVALEQANRCARVIEECKDYCSDLYADHRGSLPGSGPDYFGRIRRCIRDCAAKQGCSF